MTLQLVACWIFAAVAAAREVWRGRDAMPAPSFRSGVQIWFRYGALLTTGILVVAAFDHLGTVWDFRLKLFSWDLEAYREYVRQAVLVGFAVVFVMASSLVVRLMNKVLSVDPLK